MTSRKGRFPFEAAARLNYPFSMRLLIFIFLSLTSTLAVAEVYKWVGPDGRVQYSDRPVDGAKPIPITATTGSNKHETPLNPVVADTNLGPYTAFEVINPESNSTLRHSGGTVPISLVLDPPLMSDHRLQIELDGQKVPGDMAGTQILLQGLSFGSHRAQAVILDEFEVSVAHTEVVNFHLRKPLPEKPLP